MSHSDPSQLNMPEFSVEIFSDVICPWCFIGKRRLDQTLTRLNAELAAAVRLRWRPYQLYPNLPPEGVNRAELLRQRYGDQADSARVPERIRAEAEEEGIELRFDLIQTTPNTLLAHYLLEYAWFEGGAEKQHALAEHLFVGYFCQGRDVGSLEALLEMAAEVGLQVEVAREWLAENKPLDAVREQLQRAPELGISGVPGYYLADGFLLPGAQSSETMEHILTRVGTRMAARANRDN